MGNSGNVGITIGAATVFKCFTDIHITRYFMQTARTQEHSGSQPNICSITVKKH